MEITDEFKKWMAEWVTLKKQLTEATKDISILRKREKELNVNIKGFMEKEKIDTCNLKKGKVSLKKRKTAGTLNKETVRVGLERTFEGNMNMVEVAMQNILDAREAKESSSLSVTGMKSQDSGED
jgi:hypothetical protein